MTGLLVGFNEIPEFVETYLQVSQMMLNERYQMLSVVDTNTQYGPCKKVMLLRGNHRRFVYVPKSYSGRLSNAMIVAINSNPGM